MATTMSAMSMRAAQVMMAVSFIPDNCSGGGNFVRAQASLEAMIFAAIAFACAAVAAVVSVGNVGGGTVVGGGGKRRGVGFPGPAGIVRPNMHEHLVVILV